MFLSRKKQAGFTLIEMIVSLAIFSIIVTITIGALLVLIASNQKLQGEQSVMTNLAFAMDSMTREIRTGTDYYCAAATTQTFSTSVFGSFGQESLGDSTSPCTNGRPTENHIYQGVSFKEAGDSITGAADRVMYYYYRNNIYRRVGDQTAQPIVSSGLEIVDAEFFVSGPEPLSAGSTHYTQPAVTIHITAKELGNDKLYYLQTTVTQRTLDL